MEESDLIDLDALSVAYAELARLYTSQGDVAYAVDAEKDAQVGVQVQKNESCVVLSDRGEAVCCPELCVLYLMCHASFMCCSPETNPLLSPFRLLPCPCHRGCIRCS